VPQTLPSGLCEEIWDTIFQKRKDSVLDLLTNATVVDDAIRFVSGKSQENLKSSSTNSNEDDKGSKDPDYDEDQLEEKQEEETGEISTITTNKVFWIVVFLAHNLCNSWMVLSYR
jgi:hypothetical protein